MEILRFPQPGLKHLCRHASILRRIETAARLCHDAVEVGHQAKRPLPLIAEVDRQRRSFYGEGQHACGQVGAEILQHGEGKP